MSWRGWWLVLSWLCAICAGGFLAYRQNLEPFYIAGADVETLTRALEAENQRLKGTLTGGQTTAPRDAFVRRVVDLAGRHGIALIKEVAAVEGTEGRMQLVVSGNFKSINDFVRDIEEKEMSVDNFMLIPDRGTKFKEDRLEFRLLVTLRGSEAEAQPSQADNSQVLPGEVALSPFANPFEVEKTDPCIVSFGINKEVKYVRVGDLLFTENKACTVCRRADGNHGGMIKKINIERRMAFLSDGSIITDRGCKKTRR